MIRIGSGSSPCPAPQHLTLASANARLIPLAALTILFSLLFASGSAAAQSTRRPRRESNQSRKARIARIINETYSHKFETGGGGGYERFRSGLYQRQDNQVTFWVSTLYALNPKLGIAGEVRGAYGAAKIGNLLPSGNSLNFNPQISEYNFMAGPSYRFVRRQRYSLSGFVEAGMGLGKFAGDSKGLTAADIGVWTGTFSPSFAAGLHVDYNLTPTFAVRLTPTYLGTTYGGSVQNSKGLNVGFLYRFGHK